MPKAHPNGEQCACPGCDRTESSIWYGSKPDGPFYCKKGKCYRKGKELEHIGDRAPRAGSKRARDDDEPDTPKFCRPSTLVKLKYICGHR